MTIIQSLQKANEFWTLDGAAVEAIVCLESGTVALQRSELAEVLATFIGEIGVSTPDSAPTHTLRLVSFFPAGRHERSCPAPRLAERALQLLPDHESNSDMELDEAMRHVFQTLAWLRERLDAQIVRGGRMGSCVQLGTHACARPASPDALRARQLTPPR